MKEIEHERRDWIIVAIILLFGLLLVILAGEWALRFSSRWRLDADMGSRLNPDADFLPNRPNEFVQAIDPAVLTQPVWIDVFLTPGAVIPTRVRTIDTPSPTSTPTRVPPTNTSAPISTPTIAIVVVPATSTPTAQPAATKTPTTPPTVTTNPAYTKTPTPTSTPTSSLTSTPTKPFTPSVTSTSTATGNPASTSTATPTQTVTPTSTSTSTSTSTPAITPTSTNTPTATVTSTNTPTSTPTPTGTPTGVVTDPTPPSIGTIPDGTAYDLLTGSTLTLGINLVANSDPDWDVVYYELPAQTGILLDWVIVEISDGTNWYTIFNWGDNIADVNTNMNFNILPPPVITSYPPEETDQRDIPGTSLYTSSNGRSTGIAIDIDSIVPPGTYSYIRFYAPANDVDGHMEIDAIEVLPP